MLLTLTHEGADASDLGYLLHKNPRRPQTFELGFGKVHVFYPEVAPERCTAALLLDIDPLDLARGKSGSRTGGLFDYVNDRPYVCSSFMSTAIARVFGTALAGRCAQRPLLADTPLRLTATLAMLPARGDASLVERLFSPLGYGTHFSIETLDEQHPEWGESPYLHLTLEGTVRLRDLLRHLYVLIPVFDRQKHYWVGEEEIDKLLRHGEGWLENHPKKSLITRRYFYKAHGLARIALDRLDDGESGARDESPADDAAREPTLNEKRLSAVVEVLKSAGAASVIDLGCGEGHLLRMLLKEKQFARIAGMDVSPYALARARHLLDLDRAPDARRDRLELFQGSLTYRDDRLAGYDAAAVVEVIEHLDPARLEAFAQALFGVAKPPLAVLTTPNAEYNALYFAADPDRLRHDDHRFEWTRTQFKDWSERVAGRHGYAVTFDGIGEPDPERGAPTQMGVFRRCV